MLLLVALRISMGFGTNDKLVTSDAVLDLSHSTVNGFTVTSSNATGTNFIVHDIDTAFQVVGGSGTDTLTANGFVFSAGQRNVIFAASSIEKIVDLTGTYYAPGHAPVAGVVINGTAGNDVIDMTHTVAGQPFPTAGDDIINGGG